MTKTKLTNHQLNLLADKIIDDLQPEVDKINKERFDAVDQSEIKKSKIYSLLLKLDDFSKMQLELGKKICSVKDELNGLYFRVPYYRDGGVTKDYLKNKTIEISNPIKISRKVIETQILLSEFSNLEELVEKVKFSILSNAEENNK